MGDLLKRLCDAVAAWDETSGVVESDGMGAWHVLGYILEQPSWRALIGKELEDIPSVDGMRRCLAALCVRAGLTESELIPRIVRAVDEQLESLSEDHAKVVRRRRRWLGAAAVYGGEGGADADAETVAAAAKRRFDLLSTEAVWEEMRRYRVYLTSWRDLTAGLL